MGGNTVGISYLYPLTLWLECAIMGLIFLAVRSTTALAGIIYLTVIHQSNTLTAAEVAVMLI